MLGVGSCSLLFSGLDLKILKDGLMGFSQPCTVIGGIAIKNTLPLLIPDRMGVIVS